MLDPGGRAALLDVVRGLREQGRTVLFITHLMAEAAQADRVVVLEAGRVVFDAAPRDLFLRTRDVQRWGLTLPGAAMLAQALSGEIRGFPSDLLTIGEVVEAVVSLWEVVMTS